MDGRTDPPALDADDEPGSETLRELRARYGALVENIPAIVFIDEPSADGGSTVYVSPQVKDIFGVTPEEFAADPDLWKRSLHPDDAERVLREYGDTLEADDRVIGDYRIVRPDGRTVWIRDRATMLRDECGVPVLQQGIMYDVTDQKEAEAVIRGEVERLRRADEIARTFTDLLLSESTVAEIVQALHSITGSAVALEDTAHLLVASAGRSDDMSGTGWQSHSWSGHHTDHIGSALIDVDTGCGWVDVVVRQQRWARLHVLAPHQQSSELLKLAIERAASAVALTLLSERNAAHLADEARSALLADIAQGRFASPREVIERAAALGAHLGTGSIVAAVAEVRLRSGTADSSERERQQARRRLLEAVRTRLSSIHPGALAGPGGDRVFAIVDVGARGTAAAAELAGALAPLAEEIGNSGSATVAVGVSDPTDAAWLRSALEAAGEGAAYGIRIQRSGVYSNRDVGLDTLMLQLSTTAHLSAFVGSELSALLSHDARSNAPLLPTPRAYLRNRGRVVATAKELFIDRRTLYHRLARIEELLGRPIDDAEAQVRLDIAIRGKDILEASRTSRVDPRG